MTATQWAWSRDLEGQERKLIGVEGPDAVRFLQGLLSQDVGAVPEGEARGACLLTVKGKISFDMAVIRRGEDSFWLALPSDQAATCLEKLDRHLIMDEVELEASSAQVGFAWGDSPSAVDGVQSFACTYPVQGWLRVADEALPLGDGQAQLEDFHAHRVANGLPATGHEVVEGRFPPEVGFVDAVSYTKGCFMGQEPLSRMHSRGQSNWVMVRVALSADGVAVPAALSHPEREKAGDLTSVASVHGAPTGLAVVHRKLAVPDTQLQVDGGVEATVISGPLGQDEGVKGKGTGVVKLGGRS
jgi:folate-binding protein YgfZ